ncbi:MAG: hypothetical protein E2O76_16080 [Caldithrix sp.]|nr:MAG: hypothetical protein E2O76_16080 [Caldithrix sp.]
MNIYIVLGIVLGAIATALLTYGTGQGKKPSLSAKCYLLEDKDPCSIGCTIENDGRAEAKDVYLSFNKLLPLETSVIAKPEFGEIRLVEANRIINPILYPKSSEMHKAFSVHIPRIVPNHPVAFTVKTTNADNIRAGKQILYLEKEITKKLKDLYSAVEKKYPDVTNDLNQEILAEHRMKRYSFFAPAKVFYEEGTRDIFFLTEKEKSMAALHSDLFRTYIKEFVTMFRDTSAFIAPAIRIKTSLGEAIYRYAPPHLITSMEAEISSLIKEGDFPVPGKYDFEK